MRALEKQAAASGLADAIVFKGGSGIVPEELRKADVFLLTSVTEGFSVSLLEAMATGLICISYRYKGIEEIDPEEKYIDIIDQGDIGGAVDRIMYWSDNYGKRCSLGRETAAYARKNFYCCYQHRAVAGLFKKRGCR